jgi:hypothetical protein
MNDAVLLKRGMEALINALGSVPAERFITVILREPFDYTEWRQDNLFKDMNVEDISGAAMEWHEKHPNEYGSAQTKII